MTINRWHESNYLRMKSIEPMTRNVKYEGMTLISPMWLTQAKWTGRRKQAQGATEEKRYNEGRLSENTLFVWTVVQKRRHLENVVCMYWKTTDLKDDFVQSTDNFYISRIKFFWKTPRVKTTLINKMTAGTQMQYSTVWNAGILIV